MERDQDLSAGRMSPALSPATKEKISGRSLKPSSALKNRPPRCLRLVKKAGPTPTIMWETDGQPHTESLMHSGGECPREENVSSLSQILQGNVPRRYYLSPKACRGILRRASVRGKELPEILRIALERQAAEEPEGSS